MFTAPLVAVLRAFGGSKFEVKVIFGMLDDHALVRVQICSHCSCMPAVGV